MKNVLAVLTLVVSALAQSAMGQVRLSLPAAPLGGIATPLVPFRSSPAAALSPALSPMPAPALAPSLAPVPLP